MRQKHFETDLAAVWQRFDTVAAMFKTGSARYRPDAAYEFPALYRRICNHYALALSRQYSPALVSRLHGRVLLGHQILYKKNDFRASRVVDFFSHTFPSTFRQYIFYFWTALLLFVLPFIGTGAGCYLQGDLIYSIMDEHQVAEFEFIYDPANAEYGRSFDKQQESRVAMFGHYIRNNISIGFRTFAGGILAGAGTVFYLIFNGTVLGAVSGHVSRLGFNETFWPFVSGHGAFELTAIVISGAAGLILARAVLAPGNVGRIDALQRAAITSLHLMLGAAAMLVLAAFIEAFWSPANLPIGIKYAAASFFWTSVLLYFALAGRGGLEESAAIAGPLP